MGLTPRDGWASGYFTNRAHYTTREPAPYTIEQQIEDAKAWEDMYADRNIPTMHAHWKAKRIKLEQELQRCKSK